MKAVLSTARDGFIYFPLNRKNKVDLAEKPKL